MNVSVLHLVFEPALVLARDDFQTLTTGQGALAKAIRKQADERRKPRTDRATSVN